MKLAVTGGTGFVGRWFLRRLPADIEAVVLSRSQMREGLSLSGRTFEVRISDYGPESLAQVLTGCDSVVHLGAGRPIRAFRPKENCINDCALFLACRNIGIGNVVFASTRGVYGRNPRMPWVEMEPVTPMSEYALAKAQSELAADYVNRTAGMGIKVLRLAQVLGLGEWENSVVSVFLKQGHRREPLQVTVRGRIQREYIYVKDVADALLAAVRQPETAGIFNVGSGWSCSILDLAKGVHQAFGISQPVHMAEPSREIEEFSLMDSSRFRSTFGWAPAYTLRGALEDIDADLHSPEQEAYFGFHDH